MTWEQPYGVLVLDSVPTFALLYGNPTLDALTDQYHYTPSGKLSKW